MSLYHFKDGIKNLFPAVLMLTLILLSCAAARAEESIVQDSLHAKKLTLISGKSSILRSSIPVKRVSIAAPDIADFLLLSPHEIYITGKQAGTTNLTLWQNGNLIAVYDLNVVYDLSSLKLQINELLPDEKELRIMSTFDSITLSGRISSPAGLSQAVALARAYAPEGKINNLVDVSGIHQVMLEVRIAEMAKSTTKQLGINFNYIRGARDFGFSFLGGLTELDDKGDILLSPSVNAFFRFHNGSSDWTGFIDALKEDGLVKILAKPTLISMSGQTATFLAGGEYPIPVPQGDGNVTIDYKDFGVGLSFTPTVLDNDKINIRVNPKVSDLDFSTAVQFSGFVVPGLTTRQASTVVELKDGQSFAIAGLLQENIRDVISKFPVLGDIPILGTLFRSRSFLKNETELVIIATPRLVKPLDMANQSLPTDFYIEPNDTEFYLEGRLQGREKAPAAASLNSSLDGEFGHAMPETP